MLESSFTAMAEQIEGLLGIDKNTKSDQQIDTKLVHGYRGTDEKTGAINMPIYQTATFAHPGFDRSTGFLYTRCGNPTRLELEDTIALLEGGSKAWAFSSGMAALSTMLKLFEPGDHIVVGNDLYGGTYRLFDVVYQRYGLDFEYVEPDDAAAISVAVTPNTKAIFVETPTNPLMKVADLAALSEIARKAGALLIVDNTFLTPYYQRPFDFGADIIIHSGTKYLGGHNDILAGFIVLKDTELIEPIFTYAMSEGGMLSPIDSWLMLRSLKTLGIRLDRQQQNALEIVEYLKSNEQVTDVFYVGDPLHPDYELSKRQTSGFGSMISFKVDKPDRVISCLERLSVISYAESLGGVESLMTFPLEQTHGALPLEMRTMLGIDDRLLRLSVGIESSVDLIADLNQALA